MTALLVLGSLETTVRVKMLPLDTKGEAGVGLKTTTLFLLPGPFRFPLQPPSHLHDTDVSGWVDQPLPV